MSTTIPFTEPFETFDAWLKLAGESELNDPNAMTLATVDADGLPNARIVLLKGHGQDGFRFFTNYESTKGGELLGQGKAALLFHWKSLRRQVRIRGAVSQLSPADSDAYFATRARESRLGALASQQSRPLPGGNQGLLDAVAAQRARFEGVQDPPRPDYWGGFLLDPTEIEFWIEGDYRIHERHRWHRQGGLDGQDGWTGGQLFP